MSFKIGIKWPMASALQSKQAFNKLLTVCCFWARDDEEIAGVLLSAKKIFQKKIEVGKVCDMFRKR